MALRAGYVGIKKTLVSGIYSFLKLGITSLGSMFNVTAAGQLKVKNATINTGGIVQPDGTTITIENGIISAAAEVVDYENYQPYINAGAVPIKVNESIKIVSRSIPLECIIDTREYTSIKIVWTNYSGSLANESAVTVNDQGIETVIDSSSNITIPMILDVTDHDFVIFRITVSGYTSNISITDNE